MPTIPVNGDNYKWNNSTAKNMYNNAETLAKSQPKVNKAIDLGLLATDTATGPVGVASAATRIVLGLDGNAVHKAAIQKTAIKIEVDTMASKNLSNKIDKAINNVKESIKNTQFVDHGQGKRGRDY